MKAFIIFRDRVTYAKQCFAALADAGLEVYVVDHGSTWPAALQWLVELDEASRGERVMYRRENAYPWQLWTWGPWRDLMARDSEPYLVTDPDVVPAEDCPSDWLSYLTGLVLLSGRVKAGLGLRLDGLPDDESGAKVRAESEILWAHPWRSQFYDPAADAATSVYSANVDTTLAVYRPFTEYPLFALGPALRTGGKYLAEHLEYYERKPLGEELDYYYAHADPGHKAPRIVRSNGQIAVVHVPHSHHYSSAASTQEGERLERPRYEPPPRRCCGCKGNAVTAVNGTDLCRNCMDLVEANGGGEDGIAALMRFGPVMLRRRMSTATPDVRQG